MDVQGFQTLSNEFIVKEFGYTVLDSGVGYPNVWFFKPPWRFSSLSAKYRRVALWLERHHHGLPWNYGNRSYEQVGQLVQKWENIGRIYVKGEEKKEWLKKISGPVLAPLVVNIEEIFDDCPSLAKFKDLPSRTCPFHSYRGDNKACALKNVELLKNWMTKKRIVRSVDRSFNIYYKLNNLNLMDCEDIAYLPHSFISFVAACHVDQSWDKLTDAMRADWHIKRCRRCLEHYQTVEGDTFDGPPPMIRDCVKCNNS